VPQQAHVVDRVGAGDHPCDQRRDLQVGVATAGPGDPNVLTDQALQAGPFSELQDRRETGARHEVGIIERGGDAMADSHPTDGGCPSPRGT